MSGPELRTDLPPLPNRMRALPVDHRGYPVPFFVATVHGKPDFRVMDPDAMKRCVGDNRCWICGGALGTRLTFVCGPLAIINRISVEPPSHPGCAEFAAQACPFLAMPKVQMRDANLPADTQAIAGTILRDNPGITCLWEVSRYEVVQRPTGLMFSLEKPKHVQWFTMARPATRDQVIDALEAGAGKLMAIAGPDEQVRVSFLLKTAKRLAVAR